MMTVRFNAIEEFLEELRKSPPPDKIVRLTELYSSSKISPNLKIVSIIATYLSPLHQIVKLMHYCGNLWIGDDSGSTNKVRERIQEYHDKIDVTCRELGLEVRAGLLEEDDKQ